MESQSKEPAKMAAIFKELEAEGRIKRTAWVRNGSPVYVATEYYVRGLHDVPRAVTGERPKKS